jgi:hypothetical protein
MAEPETVGDERPQPPHQPRLKPSGSRIENDSMLYTRVLPVVLGALAVLTVALIVVAAGVLIGVIPFR